MDDNLSAIGQVISLSEFDETCYEDENQSKFEEGLQTFRNIYNEFTINCPIYLIFSKYEILEQKVKMEKIAFSQHVKDYNGNDNDINEIVKFIVNKYMEIDREHKIVKHFVISARNETQVHEMMNDIFKNI